MLLPTELRDRRSDNDSRLGVAFGAPEPKPEPDPNHCAFGAGLEQVQTSRGAGVAMVRSGRPVRAVDREDVLTNLRRFVCVPDEVQFSRPWSCRRRIETRRAASNQPQQ